MATPRRRSSRAHSGIPVHRHALLFPLATLTRTRQTPSKTANTPSRLATLNEAEPESVGKKAMGSIDAVVSPQRTTVANNDVNKTPSTAKGLAVDKQEMHPSLFQSVAKKLENEERLGFNPAAFIATPTRHGNNHLNAPNTAPQKRSVENPFSSPSFEFRFKRPSADLSTDAQRMMEEVREKAALIKEKLSAEQKEAEKNGLDGTTGMRKFATPKGKLGRYSDVHMQEFKKMDSIANHASSYRADPSRSNSPKKSLKRTLSKAELNKPDDTPSSPTKPANASKVATPTATPVTNKRIKQLDGTSKPVKDTTPSKLPRTHSVTSMRKEAASNSGPSMPRTPSKKGVRGHSSVPQTDPANKRRSAIAKGLSSVKSILRKPQIHFSNDPTKQAAGTHFAMPEVPKHEPPVSSVGITSAVQPTSIAKTPGSRLEKQVSFSPVPEVFGNSTGKEPPTPTPMKQHILYPHLPPCKALSPQSDRSSPGKVASPSVGARDFTFRAGSKINFSSPGKTQPSTPVIREEKKALRQSPGKNASFPTVPHGLSNKKRKRNSTEDDTEDKENDHDGPSEKAHMESPSKRVKMAPAAAKVPAKAVPDAAAKKRSVLSLSRLQQLAKPKARK